jgi:hypothetical protein
MTSFVTLCFGLRGVVAGRNAQLETQNSKPGPQHVRTREARRGTIAYGET